MPSKPAPPSRGFTHVHIVTEPEPTVTYRSGLTTYQEALIGGRLVARRWSGSGYAEPTTLYGKRDMDYDPGADPAPQTFWLEIDGQLLSSHWEWIGVSQQQRETALEAVIELRHTVRPVTVQVHTLLDGTPIMARWLTIHNDSDRPAALAAAYPWSGVLQVVAHDIEDEASPFSVGFFQDTHWGNEGDFDWRRLPFASYRIDGRYRRDRQRHPFFILRNHRSGEQFVGTLAWSGGYAFEFDLDDGNERGTSRLHFRAGPDAPPPLRVLAPGETVTTPEMHLGVVYGDLAKCVHALHDHLRSSVLAPQPAGLAGLFEFHVNPGQDLTSALILDQIDAAADIGVEIFFIDAGWYTPVSHDWWNTAGDWEVSYRYPDGLRPFRERTHARGMRFGLWVDAERIGGASKLAQAHPEWLMKRYDGETKLGGQIDLTVPDAAAWLEKEIERLITEHELDFFRLDYNVGNLGAAGWSTRDGYIENAYWRYYEALYGIWSRIRAKFPNVVLENCASGGARTDIGMVRHFNHTWVTDWLRAPRSFSIVSGMSMALPPERIDRTMGMCMSGHLTAELDFQLRLTTFVHPGCMWFHGDGAAPNPDQIERVRHAVGIYKEFVRPFHATSRIYHHTPVVSGLDPHGWGVLELASAGRDRALVGLFRLSDPAEPEYVVRLRGIDASHQYRVTFDNSDDTCLVDGMTLTRVGLPIRLETALTSELLLVSAVD